MAATAGGERVQDGLARELGREGGWAGGEEVRPAGKKKGREGLGRVWAGGGRKGKEREWAGLERERERKKMFSIFLET